MNLCFYADKLASYLCFSSEARKYHRRLYEAYSYHGKTVANEMKFLLADNLRLLKENPDLIFFSLGSHCYSTVLLTYWNLRKKRSEGGFTAPFDLGLNPPKAVAHFLRTDFAGYLDDLAFLKQFHSKFSFDFHNVCALPSQEIVFAHDTDLATPDLGPIRSRLQRRADLFRKALDTPGQRFAFLCGTVDKTSFEDYIELYQAVRSRLGGRDFAFAVADTARVFEGVSTEDLPFPVAAIPFSPPGSPFNQTDWASKRSNREFRMPLDIKVLHMLREETSKILQIS